MSAPASTRSTPAVGTRVLQLLTAPALAASAYLHVALAQGPLVSAGQITVAGLFVGQAVVAALAAVAVLLRPGRAAWAAAAAVALGTLAAVVLFTYVRLPAVGPFPAVYEPSWYRDKVLAAATAAVAAGAALGGLARTRARA